VDQSIVVQLPQLPTVSELDTFPSPEVMAAAANKWRDNKAPGPDGIPAKCSNMGSICRYSDSTPSLAMGWHRIFFSHNGKMLI